MPWLVQQPSKEECVRARKLKPAQMNRLETVWKYDPDATLEQVQEDPAAQKDLLKVACRYENAFEYQNVLAPLVQIEADYDKVCDSCVQLMPFFTVPPHFQHLLQFWVDLTHLTG